MKRLSVLMLLFALIATSCSKEDESPTSELEKVKFSAMSEDDLIEVPPTMKNSENAYVQQAVAQIELANAFTQAYSSFMSIPKGAQKTTEPIIPSNARISTTTQYLVYTWSSDDMSIAYQLHATDDMYVLEIFIKLTEGDWELFFYGEQKKDGKKGEIRFYELFGSGELAWTYRWDITTDIYKFTMFDEMGNKIYVEVNKSTGAGKVDYILENSLYLTVTWTGQGSGTWTYYGDGGEDSGTW